MDPQFQRLRQAALHGHVTGRPPGLLIGVLVVSALGAGLIVLGTLAISVQASGDTTPFWSAVVLAALPVPLLLAGILALDRLEPEPPVVLLAAFAYGAGLSTLVAGILNDVGAATITVPAFGAHGGELVSAVVGAPLIEESLKGLALLFLLHGRRHDLDGITDAVIYAAMVGLGFAFVENITYYIDAALVGGEQLAVLFVLRGLASPLAHPLFTLPTAVAVVAFSMGRVRAWAIGAGWLAAVGLHALWNGMASLGLGQLAVAWVVLLIEAVVVIVAVVRDRRAHVAAIGRVIPAYSPYGLASPADVAMLMDLKQRRGARRVARATGGSVARTAMADYQQSATELALLHDRLDRGAADDEVHEARRQQLLALMGSARQYLALTRPPVMAPFNRG